MFNSTIGQLLASAKAGLMLRFTRRKSDSDKNQKVLGIANSLQNARRKSSILRDISLAYLGQNSKELQLTLYQLETNLGLWAFHLENHLSGYSSLDTLSRRIDHIKEDVEDDIKTSILALKEIVSVPRPETNVSYSLQSSSLSLLRQVARDQINFERKIVNG